MPAVSRIESGSGLRVLVGGVGYHNLRDSSIGPVLIEQIRNLDWPQGVEFEDMSYGPIGIMHNLESREPYDRLVLIAGLKRGRKPGSVHSYQWQAELPQEEEVQARVAEAVTGVVSLDNLLIIGSWFRKLPKNVIVIEIETNDENWGPGFSDAVSSAIPEVIKTLRSVVRQPKLPETKVPINDLDQLLERLENDSDDSEAGENSELLRSFLQLHAGALRRVVEVLNRRGQQAIVHELLADPLVGTLIRGYGVDLPSSPVASTPPDVTFVSVNQLLASGRAKSRTVPLLHQFELRHGDFFKVQFFEEELLVCNVQGQPFAFKNRCPESGGPLDKAELKQYAITCPCHHHAYDLRTGEAADQSPLRLEIMPVTVEDGVIRVDL